MSDGNVRVIHLCKMEISDRSGCLLCTCHHNAAEDMRFHSNILFSFLFFPQCQLNVTRLLINDFIQLFMNTH